MRFDIVTQHDVDHEDVACQGVVVLKLCCQEHILYSGPSFTLSTTEGTNQAQFNHFRASDLV